MSNAWTPGPWQINGSHFYGPDPDRFLIGHMNGGGPFDANLRLIAAAPELYAALKMAQLWLDVDGRFDMQGINAALAKARGEA